MTDMRFIIPNQSRRNWAASRLKRDGLAVHVEETHWEEPEHPLDVYGVEAESEIEDLVSQIAPGSVRAL